MALNGAAAAAAAALPVPQQTAAAADLLARIYPGTLSVAAGCAGVELMGRRIQPGFILVHRSRFGVRRPCRTGRTSRRRAVAGGRGAGPEEAFDRCTALLPAVRRQPGRRAPSRGRGQL